MNLSLLCCHCDEVFQSRETLRSHVADEKHWPQVVDALLRSSSSDTDLRRRTRTLRAYLPRKGASLEGSVATALDVQMNRVCGAVGADREAARSTAFIQGSPADSDVQRVATHLPRFESGVTPVESQRRGLLARYHCVNHALDLLWHLPTPLSGGGGGGGGQTVPPSLSATLRAWLAAAGSEEEQEAEQTALLTRHLPADLPEAHTNRLLQALQQRRGKLARDTASPSGSVHKKRRV